MKIASGHRRLFAALGIAVATGLAGATLAAPAQARWGDHHDWDRDHHDRDHDHDRYRGHWHPYRPPPVVYYGGGYGYYPPPVYDPQPGVGIYVPGISLDIH